MAALSSSPAILKGAFVKFDPEFPQGQIIVFQYNPDKIKRKLVTNTDRHFPIKSPSEIITFTLLLDATDALESSSQNIVKSGIYSRLSAFEILLYPHRLRMDKKGLSWN